MGIATQRRARRAAGRKVELLSWNAEAGTGRLRVTTAGRVGYYDLRLTEVFTPLAVTFTLTRSGSASTFDLFVIRQHGDCQVECQCRDFIWSGHCRHVEIVEQLHQKGKLPA